MIIDFLKKNSAKFAIILVILLSGITFGLNLFHFPYYEDDEGTYMSQAWSISTQGHLAPYTYWYDHAPGGWTLISVWAKITGGYFTFGPSVNSGRVLMLVIHILTAIVLYLLTVRITRSKLAGILAVTIFTLSPLALYFQRRVLLDNIMAFWLLLSLYILTRVNLKLRQIVLSSVFFAIAVLSKENAVFAFPVMIYGIWINTEKEIRKFAVSIWAMISIFLISIYPLYALLKNELFPASNDEHVSLIGTLKFDASRGSHLPIWNHLSDFYLNLMDWLVQDKYIIIAGFSSLFICILLSIKRKELRLPTFAGLSIFLFFLRGGLLLNFYILPLIPFFALYIATVVAAIVGWIPPKIKYARNIILTIAIFMFAYLVSNLLNFKPLFTVDETTPQTEGIQWIKDNLQPTDKIIVDDYAYVDLHDTYYNSKIFPNAEWYFKVEDDPAVRITKLNNDWRNTDYVFLSHAMATPVENGTAPFTAEALMHASLIKLFTNHQLGLVTDTVNFGSYTTDFSAIYIVNKTIN